MSQIHFPSASGGCGCFSGRSMVRVKDYNDVIVEKELQNLYVNEEVESVDEETGELTFSRVYAILHDDDENPSRTVLKIKYRGDQEADGEIQITANHILYIMRGPRAGQKTVQAKKIKVGDYLPVRSGDRLVPRQVTEITKLENVDILAPLTMNHHIVVNGVHASAHVYNDRAMRYMTWSLRKPALAPVVRRIAKAFY